MAHKLTSKVIVDRLFRTLCKRKRAKKKVISIYLQMFCIPQVENGTQRRAENESRRSRADGAGASSVAVRQSPSDPNQKLRSLSSSLGRYHELRRDRGRWVGYVHEAGGINGANLQERCRGRKRGQTPRGAERASRHGPETARTLLAQRTSGNDPSFLLLSTTLENLVCFGVTWQLNPLGTRVFSLMISYFSRL